MATSLDVAIVVSPLLLVQNGGVGPGCDPAAGSARRLRDPDKENRIAAPGRRNPTQLSAKLGIAVDAQRPRAGVEHPLIAGAGVADQRASHRGDRPGGAAEDRAVNVESVDFPSHSSGGQVHTGRAASRGPGKRAAANVADGIVDVQGGNYADDPVPAHDIVLACER